MSGVSGNEVKHVIGPQHVDVTESHLRVELVRGGGTGFDDTESKQNFDLCDDLT